MHHMMSGAWQALVCGDEFVRASDNSFPSTLENIKPLSSKGDASRENSNKSQTALAEASDPNVNAAAGTDADHDEDVDDIADTQSFLEDHANAYMKVLWLPLQLFVIDCIVAQDVIDLSLGFPFAGLVLNPIVAPVPKAIACTNIIIGNVT